VKKIYAVIATLVALTLMGATNLSASQSVQVWSSDNSSGKLTPKTVEDGFEKAGLGVDGNNDMNKPFSKRFKHVHYKIYNLAMFKNDALTLKLIKKYPNFGALTPLTMSIWSDDKAKTLNVATLSLAGMSRATGIPTTDPDLVAYAKLVKTALKNGMPNGHFKKLPFVDKFPKKSFAINFEADVDLDDGQSANEFKEDFEAEFEGELEPLGFLLPNFTNLQEDLFDDAGYDVYDFYDTYSICKFDVIYPVSKLHPEAGAYAPCSFFIYKKKGEDKMHMGYLGVDNWITTLGIEDKESINPLKEAQGMINNIIKEMTE
jgi:uncharacterized protein (DUF302 family)